MKKPQSTEWIVLIILTVASCILWHRITYPTFSFIDFSIDRKEAVDIASQSLQSIEPDTDQYLTAVAFMREENALRYLQKNLGFHGLLDFIQEHQFDIFVWHIRFFKEGEEEEYRYFVSASSGKIVSFKHKMDHSAFIASKPKEQIFQASVDFLQKHADFKKDNFELKTDTSNTLVNREEYFFAWDKKDVLIPWSKDPKADGAQLITNIVVSGDQVIAFNKNVLLIPQDYLRFIGKKSDSGINYIAVIRLLYYFLLALSVFFIVSRNNHLAAHCTKTFYIYIFIFVFFLLIANNINSIQFFLINYPTTSPLKNYLYRLSIDEMSQALFFCIALILPGIAGESLRLETNKNHSDGSFLHFLYSSFFSRHVAKLIVLGYMIAMIMFGIQSILFEIGQSYLGVWQENVWKTQHMTNYLPSLTAFTHAFKSSMAEELLYRLFTIHLFVKLFKRTWLAIFLSAVIWGFAHTNFPIFPMWFRGLEMTSIGIFLGIMYMRFGLIPVVIGHFLFNLYWHTIGYILGESSSFSFYSSVAALGLPLLWALIAFLLNRSDKERPVEWMLNKAQTFNLKVLESYLKTHKEEYRHSNPEELKKEIAKKGWDYAVVDQAVHRFLKSTRSSNSSSEANP